MMNTLSRRTMLRTAGGGFGYLANLLVWHADGYYASPYVYLISAGIVLAARDPVPPRGAWLGAEGAQRRGIGHALAAAADGAVHAPQGAGRCRAGQG